MTDNAEVIADMKIALAGSMHTKDCMVAVANAQLALAEAREALYVAEIREREAYAKVRLRKGLTP